MQRPLVFLDIDGVARPNTKPNDYKINSQNAALLNRAFAAIDAEVVISSNWRLVYPLTLFQKHFGARVIGKTSDLASRNLGDYIRWYEVKHFMQTQVGRPFCILDDQADLFPATTGHLILCDGDLGFTQKKLDEMLLLMRQ